jgi:type IV secretory pathway TraG/TraD family ATPase VirD4
MDIVPFGGQLTTRGANSALNTQGSAGWMPPELAVEKGLYDGEGLLFARGSKGMLRYTRGKHAIVCAPSRSGKGIGFVIPNLLTWRGSCFAIDPKGELAHFTAARRREMGQRVYVLDPCRVSGQKTSKFNPLEWLKDSHDLDTDLSLIIEALTPDNTGNASFWNGAARELLGALIMYQIAIFGEEKNLGRTFALLNLPENEWENLLKKMVRCDGGSQSLNAKVREKANWFASLHDEHKQYHRGTLQYHLAWLGISAAREMVSTSDFDMRELKREKATMYVCIPALNTSAYEGFTRLLSTLAIKATSLSLVPPGSKEPPILLMLDEFATTIGRLKVFDDAYTNIAGYGGRFAIILQTVDQLQSLFPERKGNQSWKTVYENAGLRVFFDAQDDTAEFVSKKLGVTTVNQISPIGGAKQVQRQLLFPNEVSFPIGDDGKHIPDAMFAFVEGWPPLRARRLCSYRDGEFVSLHDPDNAIPEFKPTGLTEWQQAQLGYGAGVEKNANIADRLALQERIAETPTLTEKEREQYVKRYGAGWG